MDSICALLDNNVIERFIAYYKPLANTQTQLFFLLVGLINPKYVRFGNWVINGHFSQFEFTYLSARRLRTVCKHPPGVCRQHMTHSILEVSESDLE